MSNWVRVASAAECPPGTALERIAEGRVVALYNVDGAVYALDGVCPHQGGPLGEGELQSGVVTCPWHGWQFDVSTGKCLVNELVNQPRIPVRVDGGAIFIDLDVPAE